MSRESINIIYKNKIMNIEEIENKLNPCKYCGNNHPKVYHQDYCGDTYIGDEYSINCRCGISTDFHKLGQLFEIWNKSDKKITNYKIRIGDKLDYIEYGENKRYPVIITDISFDGFVFLIQFKHENFKGIGSTQYPDKLKQRL
jgi:hypothetical protein